MHYLPYLALPVLIAFGHGAKAQTAMASAGGEATGQGSVSWTIGQPFYEPTNEPNIRISPGVQQAYILFATGLDEVVDDGLRFDVAPNPTINSVRLFADMDRHTALRYELFGFNGQRIRGARLAGHETTIPMEDLGAGTYLLRVYAEGRTLRTIRIIKSN